MLWLGKVLLITMIATTVKGGSKDMEEIKLIVQSHDQPHLTVSDSVPWFIDYDFEDERSPEYQYETSTENVSHILVVRGWNNSRCRTHLQKIVLNSAMRLYHSTWRDHHQY